jgi:site-specific DNA-cytosine methylase
MFGSRLKQWSSIREALKLDATIIGGGRNPTPDENDKRTYRDITEEPSTTVAAVQIGNAGPFVLDDDNPDYRRRLTWKECAVLQGFPNDYPFTGRTKASIYRQVGNAVCPKVSEVLARCVMKAMIT